MNCAVSQCFRFISWQYNLKHTELKILLYSYVYRYFLYTYIYLYTCFFVLFFCVRKHKKRGVCTYIKMCLRWWRFHCLIVKCHIAPEHTLENSNGFHKSSNLYRKLITKIDLKKVETSWNIVAPAPSLFCSGLVPHIKNELLPGMAIFLIHLCFFVFFC